MMNNDFPNIAKEYKRTVAGRFMLVEGAKLKDKISGEEFLVTKKMDGIMLVVFVRDGEVCAYTSHGNPVPDKLSCIQELKTIVAQYGINNLTLGAELYATIRTDGRERVCDVAKAIAHPELHDKLHIAPFDIIDIEGEPCEVSHYKEKLDKLNRWFGKGNLVRQVDARKAASKEEVCQIFNEWVVDGGSEGLVVHSEQPIIYKVKPRHTIDAVIIGYTVGEDSHSEMLRDMLLAVMRPDGVLQQFASTGNGLTEEMRSEFYEMLRNDKVESEYVETDSRNVAFQMVKPRVIVEMSGIDFVTENAAGEPKQNMLLKYDDEQGYTVVIKTPGAVVHSPVFERIRNDKSCNASDIRLKQLTDLCSFSVKRAVSRETLPNSLRMLRRVFVKQTGGKIMIQKYVVWKTNKEPTGVYPAYVLHITDYSSTRQELLKRDLRVSDSEQQIMDLCQEMIDNNVKKGWEEI